IEKDGAKLDEITGFLSWDLELKPRETRKVTFTYTVRYPEDKIIAAL
ncbi:MAG: hypothetical protein IH946_09775, partial [Bacteroidetes bacterium]|nr:hypothetical protein [Bacteroidota bacterium]